MKRFLLPLLVLGLLAPTCARAATIYLTDGANLTQALKDAERNTTIDVAAGNYRIATNRTSLLKADVNWHFHNGAKILTGNTGDSAAGRNLFNDYSGALTSSVTGFGEFYMTNTDGTILGVTNSASLIVFQAKTVIAATNLHDPFSLEGSAVNAQFTLNSSSGGGGGGGSATNAVTFVGTNAIKITSSATGMVHYAGRGVKVFGTNVNNRANFTYEIDPTVVVTNVGYFTNTIYLTPRDSATLWSTLSSANPGTLFKFGAGTFLAPSNQISVPQGVWIDGSGMDVTTILAPWCMPGSQFILDANHRISNLTVDLTNRLVSGLFQNAFGENSSAVGSTNVYFRNVRVKGATDCIQITQPQVVRWYFDNCEFETGWDTFVQQFNGTNRWTFWRNCRFTMNKDTSQHAVNAGGHGFAIQQGYAIIENSTFFANLDTSVVFDPTTTSGTGAVWITGSKIDTVGSTLNYHINNQGTDLHYYVDNSIDMELTTGGNIDYAVGTTLANNIWLGRTGTYDSASTESGIYFSTQGYNASYFQFWGVTSQTDPNGVVIGCPGSFVVATNAASTNTTVWFKKAGSGCNELGWVSLAAAGSSGGGGAADFHAMPGLTNSGISVFADDIFALRDVTGKKLTIAGSNTLQLLSGSLIVLGNSGGAGDPNVIQVGTNFYFSDRTDTGESNRIRLPWDITANATNKLIRWREMSNYVATAGVAASTNLATLASGYGLFGGLATTNGTFQVPLTMFQIGTNLVTGTNISGRYVVALGSTGPTNLVVYPGAGVTRLEIWNTNAATVNLLVETNGSSFPGSWYSGGNSISIPTNGLSVIEVSTNRLGTNVLVIPSKDLVLVAGSGNILTTNLTANTVAVASFASPFAASLGGTGTTNIVVDFTALGITNDITFTASANFSIVATNVVAGKVVRLALTQGTAGFYTCVTNGTYNPSNLRVGTTVTGFNLSTNGGYTDVVSLYGVGTNALLAGNILGFNGP
jgi:hypothetical protein